MNHESCHWANSYDDILLMMVKLGLLSDGSDVTANGYAIRHVLVRYVDMVERGIVVSLLLAISGTLSGIQGTLWCDIGHCT